METSLSIIENYEIVNKKEAESVAITYSLADSNKLVDLESVYVFAKEKNNSMYDLVITNENGKELIVFKDLDNQNLQEIRDKRILIAGLSEDTNEISEVCAVLHVSIEGKRKIRFGG
ncbi:hypothetical protein GW796_00765 [archaeon]|nr:hypothetical protein [archaeon]NCQ50437.1 hypothetical protein [archaeon]